MDRESCQATSGRQGHRPRGRPPPSASVPGRPPFSRGGLSGVLLLPGERQPGLGRLHEGPGPHREAPAGRRPPPAHRGPGRELLFRGPRREDPRGSTERGPGLRQFEGERLHPDQAGGVHTAPGHEGGGR